MCEQAQEQRKRVAEAIELLYKALEEGQSEHVAEAIKVLSEG